MLGAPSDTVHDILLSTLAADNIGIDVRTYEYGEVKDARHKLCVSSAESIRCAGVLLLIHAGFHISSESI